MTLEDFFTLTEMKDGLTAPSRVEELVSVMQKEENCVMKNRGDATRQWAAVASTIAATENKDCIDRFIQLDGLWFINRWLKDAQHGNDTSDSFVDESITALLRALEKLNIDNERSISSGIWNTVKNLLGHNSSRVQDRARALFDSWEQGRFSDAVHRVVESVGAHHDDGIPVSAMLSAETSRPECSTVDVPVSKGNASEENHEAQPAEAETLPLRSSEGLQPGNTEKLQIQTHNNELHSNIILDHTDTEDRCPDHLASSVVLHSVKENPSMKEKSPMNTVNATEPCNFPVPEQGSVEGQSDTLRLNEFSKDEKQMHKLSNLPEKMDVTASAPNKVEVGAVSSGANAVNAQENVTEPALQNDFDANEGDSCLRSSALGDVGKPSSEPKNMMDDEGITTHCSPQVFKTGQDGECHSDVLQDSSANECIYAKPDHLGTSFSRMEDLGDADEDKEQTSDEGEDFRNGSDFSKPTSSRSPDVIDKTRSDIELDYGMDDALEVARKVAQEVEREVVDYREPSCSSSEKISEGEIRQPNSPDSIHGNQDLPTEAPPKEEVPTGQNHSAVAYPKEGPLINTDNLESEPENCINDMESSQVPEAAQEPEVNTEKGLCDFDLNQEVCSDDMDRPVNSVSAPISVVSASRPAAAPGLPAAPLRFEGTLGWKGSAATSAFRPASPRRISDGDKTLSIGGTSNSSKQRQDCLDFDLNVAEGGDDKPDLMSGKQIPVSSDLQSAESSLEMSPRRSERLKLDLNRISDDGDAPAPPSDLRMEGRIFYNRNGHRSPSPASSSSSMQPSMRNIDLNDRPFFHNDSSDQGLYQGGSSQNVSAYIGPKPDDPVISIMGTRVEVNRKDFIPQALPLPNGKALEPASDSHVARTGGLLGMGPAVSYTHSPVFGYNGLTTAPAMSFSSAMYEPGGPIRYMVDSRGAPVVPQIVGSVSAVPPPYSQPPFIMSMTGAPSGLNGAGPSRPTFDLNSGFAIEGGSRDSVGLRPLFMPGQGRSIEEHLRANSQPSSSSGVGVKRKEPDSGWEPYPFNHRNQQPPWK